MKGRIAELLPRLSTRVTGVVYLLYFLTAVCAEAFVGHSRHVLYDSVNFIAYAFYIAVTLLLVNLPAANSGRANGSCRVGLVDLSVTARNSSIHLS
jgi:hypothetical protein